ncbi:hypothetical protein DRP77_07760 [Candidatus Poribacteria bacterium]|nr:MAG: hypothetical protein DRP77_07760 [Candidatus Poribacteria bacterium]
MSFDLYVDLAYQRRCPQDANLPAGLASGFVDECTVWSAWGSDERREAREFYMRRVLSQDLYLPEELRLEPDFKALPNTSWIGFEIRFTFQTPWYSKDDRPFHVLDNPVRKDRVFGVPFMPASSWKGLLRWACRIQAGLHEHLESQKGRLEGWRDPSWIIFLFGNEKGEESRFQRGALAFYPTWFSRIGFEVINPHSRARRAGVQPIYYEVVPAGTPGVLRFLYAPLPGVVEREEIDPVEALEQLLCAAEQLLTIYGISAKRTVGWGTAAIDEWKAYRKGSGEISGKERADFWGKLWKWISQGEGS